MSGYFISGLNLFKEIIKVNITGKREPIYVLLQVTKHCNLRCKYCYSELDNLKDVPELTTDEIYKLIDELYSMGTRWIRLLGGEPLMRQNIEEIIDHIKKKNMFCEITTNGYLFEQKIELLKKVDSVCLSVDGSEKVTDELRGKGTYQVVLKALEVAKKHKLKVRLHGVLVQPTKNEIDNLHKLALKYDCYFNYTNMQPSPNSKKNELVVSNDEVMKFFNELDTKKRQGYKVINSTYFFDHVKNWPDKDSSVIMKKDIDRFNLNHVIPCQAGRLSCWVDSDGSLYACPLRWKDGLNIKKVGLQKAWDYIKDVPCYACHASADNEAYAIMILSPKVLANAFFVVFKDLLEKR